MTDLALKLAVEGDLQKHLDAKAKGVARAVTSAVRSVTFGLQREIKRQVKRAKFKSNNLENTVIAKVNPRRGFLPDAEGVVYSVANVKRDSGTVDLLEVFDTGATIRAAGGKWLAIPTEHAPAKALKKTGVIRRRASNVFAIKSRAESDGQSGASGRLDRKARRYAQKILSDFTQSGVDGLRFVPSRNPALASLQYTSKARGQAVVAYWLVKQVHIKKRLDIKGAMHRWLPKLEPKINSNLDKLADKLGADI